MATIILPQRWTKQPQHYVEANPLFAPKIGLWNFSQSLQNLVRDDFLTVQQVTTVPSRAAAKDGLGWKFSEEGQRLLLPDYSALVGSEATCLIVYNAVAYETGGASRNCPWTFGTGSFPDEVPFGNDGNTYCDAFTNTRWCNNINSAPIRDVRGLAVLAVQARSGAMRLSINNVTVQENAGAFTIALPATSYWLGDLRFNDADFRGRTVYAALLDNRRWEDEELAELVKNPWQLFRSLPRRMYFDGAAAAPVTDTRARQLASIGCGL